MVKRWTEAKSAGSGCRSQRESREGKRKAGSGWSLVDTNHFLGICPFSYFAGGTFSLGTHTQVTEQHLCPTNVRRMSDKRELTAK